MLHYYAICAGTGITALHLFNLNATPTRVSKLRAARIEVAEPNDDSNHESKVTHAAADIVGHDCIFSFR